MTRSPLSFFAGLGLGAALLVALPTFAHGPDDERCERGEPGEGGRFEGRGRHGKGGDASERRAAMLEHLLDEVDATDAQRAAILKLTADAPDRFEGRREEREEHRAKFRAALTADPVDTRALLALHQEAAERFDAEGEAAIERLVAVASVLTPEQRAEAADKLAHFGRGRR